MLVLSLFPGIGLLDMAFEEAGFCVVRGPDLLWGGDIRRFHPSAGRFDGVIGGPPCQIFSRMRHIQPKAGQAQGNLIPEFERCVSEARPGWFLMENVPEAPEPAVPGYIVHAEMIRDVWVGGATSRLRCFCFGSSDGRRLQVETVALHTLTPAPTVTASGGTPPGWKPTARHIATRKGKAATGYKTASYLAVALRDQGLPADFLRDAPFTIACAIKAIGNAVPLPMGRAVAQAVLKAMTKEAA